MEEPALIRCGDEAEVNRAVAVAVDHLEAGRLVVFPTDTVYGVGVDASNEGAVERLFAVKKRPPSKPVALFVPDRQAPADIAELSRAGTILMEAFWPGPLTVVLRRRSRIAETASGGSPTIGLRLPDASIAKRILFSLGRPIATTSANVAGGSPWRAAAEHSGDLSLDVDLVLDAGQSGSGRESTVVDATGARPVLLREGAIARAELVSVLRARHVSLAGRPE